MPHDKVKYLVLIRRVELI